MQNPDIFLSDLVMIVGNVPYTEVPYTEGVRSQDLSKRQYLWGFAVSSVPEVYYDLVKGCQISLRKIYLSFLHLFLKL